MQGVQSPWGGERPDLVLVTGLLQSGLQKAEGGKCVAPYDGSPSPRGLRCICMVGGGDIGAWPGRACACMCVGGGVGSFEPTQSLVLRHCIPGFLFQKHSCPRVARETAWNLAPHSPDSGRDLAEVPSLYLPSLSLQRKEAT